MVYQEQRERPVSIFDGVGTTEGPSSCYLISVLFPGRTEGPSSCYSMLELFPGIEGSKKGQFQCPDCGSSYKHKFNLTRHRAYECGVQPRFQCPFCPHKTKRKENLQIHVLSKHNSQTQVQIPKLF
ncbi:hypothetical protein J6590_014833 [Homalodisca vitripennis]|nr:hypothetical protein J6590_014833 [Homalodisca vitripennis]